ncbi:MAG: MtrB/PioB family outer membrane beta-barrel protein [Leptolyngbyaceae cyanobacterium]
MLSHFYQSVYRACGCLPIVLIGCPLIAYAGDSEASTSSPRSPCPDNFDAAIADALSFSACKDTRAELEPPSLILATGLEAEGKDREMFEASSIHKNSPLQPKKQHQLPEIEQAPILGLMHMSTHGSKPDLLKDKLTTASPLISEFVLSQSPLMTAETNSFAEPQPPDNDSLEFPPVSQIPPSVSDPELGVIQLRDPFQDPELGAIRLRDPQIDSELGILRLSPLPPAVPDPPNPATPPAPQEPPRRPFLYLSTYVSASSSDNVFLATEPRRLDDTFIRRGISLTAFPSIGPRTFLLASVDANFLRYQDFTASSYNELRFRAGIRHSFTNRVYGQLSWTTQFLFREDFDDRFFRLDERFFRRNGIELFLGRRDLLLPGLTLDSYYQGQLFFSDPIEFSTAAQSLGVSLSYRFNSQWDTRLGYQITITDFTQDDRHETSQRVTAQLRYSLSPSVRMSLFGGIGFGRSSESSVSFDSSFFGISLDATVPIF